MKLPFYPFALAAAVLSGCAVYVPTVPSTPLLAKAGEVEAVLAARNFSSGELSAAWSPAQNLLLTTEGALQQSEGSETRNGLTTNYVNFHRQASLGLGTYRLLGKNQSTYLAAVGGVGFAKANIYDPNVDLFTIFGSNSGAQYEANYRRYYGQVYVASLGRTTSYGGSLRAVYVDYNRLLRNGAPIMPPTRVFVEPSLFLRVGRGSVQGQGTLGLSMPKSRNPDSEENNNLAPSTVHFSVGIVVRPHLWKTSKTTAAPVPQP